MTAENVKISRDQRLILILAFDGVTMLDVVGPAEVFDVAARTLAPDDVPDYRVQIASVRGGAVTSSSGLKIETRPCSAYADVPIDTIIVPGGGPPTDPPVPGELVDWLRELAPQARRICTICTGTFLLAAAGLVTGRHVTTHWMAAGRLATLYPEVCVDADPIFVKDGAFWSSAGFTAGIDMALAMFEEDVGHDSAMQLARLLILYIKRPGVESQFSVPLAVQSRADTDFSELHAWIRANLAKPLMVEDLADRMGMAPRTFARRYMTVVGQTPAKTIAALRLDAARKLMRDQAMPLKDIARKTGFRHEQNLRRTIMRFDTTVDAFAVESTAAI